MSDTIKELLTALDLPEELAEKPIDDITEAFHGKWINRNLASADPEIRAKTTGHFMDKIQKHVAREFGLEPEETKDKQVEDYIKIAAQKAKTKITELEESLKGGDQGEWQKKLEKATKEATQYKEMVSSLKEEKEKSEAEWNTKLKNTTLNYAVTGLKANLPYADEFTADPLKKKGFEAHINDSYNFDFNEEGVLIVTDKKGEQIKNEGKNGLLSPEDLLKTELKKFNGLKITTTTPPKGTPPARREEPKKVVVNGQERNIPANLRDRLGR